MRAGLGVVVHTGWAACVVAEGGRGGRVLAREQVEMLGDPERFVFHRAAEMKGDAAAVSVAEARRGAVEQATRVMRRLAGAGAGVRGCAIVAKAGTMPPLSEELASHLRIHSAEGLFFRDALVAAAEECGLKVRVVPPQRLDATDPQLVEVGRALGKPWTADWKLATLAAWSAAS